MDNNRTKRIFLLIIGVLLLLWLVVWVFTHSFLEITVANNKPGDITYEIKDQADGRTVAYADTNKTSFKKILKRGNYQVSVTQKGPGQVAAVHQTNIFTKTRLNLVLKEEVSRTFIGDRPGYCMQYAEEVLISDNCGGRYEDMKTHIPATEALPTHTLNDEDGLKATNEGFLTTPEGNFLLVLQPISEDDTYRHILYRINRSKEKASALSQRTDLVELNPAITYSVRSYGTGFIAYDSSFSQVFYYSGIGARGTELKLGAANKSLAGQSITSSSRGVAVTRSNIGTLDKKSLKEPATEVALLSGDNIRHLSFKKQYNSALPCGTSKICALSGNVLDIYNIEKEKPRLLYSLADVLAINDNGNSLGIVTSYGLLDFDPEKREGSYLYSFGGYSFQTLGVADKAFILGLSTQKSREAALLISAGTSDDIDKKVLEIEGLPEVNSVSAYKNFVFLTPNLGEPTYNPDTGFGFEPAVRASVNDSIGNAIKKIGLDTNTYKVINVIP